MQDFLEQGIRDSNVEAAGALFIGAEVRAGFQRQLQALKRRLKDNKVTYCL